MEDKLKIICLDTGEEFTVYAYYLNSLHWENKKREFKKSKYFVGKCYQCNRAVTRVEIHHKHYNSLGCEKLEDLKALCPKCHGYAHRRPFVTSKVATTVNNFLSDPIYELDNVDEYLTRLDA